MKKLIVITVALAATGALAALTEPACAQRSKQQTPLQVEETQRQQERARVEKQYDAALKKTNGATGAPSAVDPWANMRGTDDSKAKR